MIKKILFFLFIFALTNCGYQPIYVKNNNLDLVINNFQLSGNKNINRKIINFLNLKKDNSSNYNLVLSSNKKLETISKDKTGKALIYKTSIVVDILVNERDKTFKQKTFSSNFIYKNQENKFDLSQYQKNIDLDLMNKIMEDIFIFLKSK